MSISARGYGRFQSTLTYKVEEIYQPVMETRCSTVGVFERVVGCASTSGRPPGLGRKSRPVCIRMSCNYIFQSFLGLALLAAFFFGFFETNNDQRPRDP